jgi:hypothetical protein
MKYSLYSLALSITFFPSVTLAQGPNLNYLDSAVESFGQLITQLIPIVIALALLVFIWGLVKFIASSGDETAKAEGKSRMVWGIIALFVIVAVWGLVGLLADITGIEVGGNIDAPGVNI